jgi:hypothetical protein
MHMSIRKSVLKTAESAIRSMIQLSKEWNEGDFRVQSWFE